MFIALWRVLHHHGYGHHTNTTEYIQSHPIFTALHGMQTRSSDEISVCLSVKRVHCDKTEEKSVQIFIPCDR